MIHRPRTKAGLMSNLYWLSEAQMERLRPYFPKSHGVPRVDDRRFLGGIILINRIGLHWRDAQRECGPTRPSTIAEKGGAIWACSRGS
jgi:transposase